MASKDDNRVNVLLARNPSGQAIPLKVDNSTGYLNVTASSGSGSTQAFSLKRDANHVPCMNVKNPDGDVKILSFDDNNNGIYIVNNTP